MLALQNYASMKNLLRKHAVKKAKQMFYKPQFIIHVVKDLLKSYTVVRK